MKNIFLKPVVFLLMSAVTLASCKKLIEIPSNAPGTISNEQIFADSANIMGALAGVYNNMQTTINFFPQSSGVITITAGLASDELTLTGTNADLLQINNNAILPPNAYTAGIWTSSYSTLYLVNACIEGITTTTKISLPLKQQLIGELRVIRAFTYFHLVNLFGGVPIVTASDYKVNAALPKATVDAVYDQITGDLNAARELLKPAYPSTGRARPNLYTASALLAKVYLYREQWKQAADLASEVVNSGQYILPADVNEVFLDGSKEAIWQLPAKGLSTQTSEAFAFIPYNATTLPSYLLTDHLLGAFEANDQRRVKWTSTSTVASKTYYYPYKYKNISSVAATTEGYVMLREADLLLIRAEALSRLNKPDSALDDLNRIRVRAGLIKSTAAGQPAILNAILNERRTELFCEWGNRWYDLKRTGTINAVLSVIKTGWKNTAAFYPIPLSEIQNDPYIEQNQGY